MSKRIDDILYWTVFCIFIAGMGVMFTYIPYGSDDIVACDDIGINHYSGQWTMTFDSWRTFYGWMFYCDNIRLANMLILPLLMFPKWVVGLMSTALLAVDVILSCRIMGMRRGQWRLMAVLCLLLTYGLPWYDNMAYFRFQTNYVWAVTIQFALILLVLKQTDIKWWLALGLGLFCGMWHEGMAAVTFGALASLWLFRRDEGRPKTLWMLAGILIGVIILALAPGTTARTDQMEPFAFPWLNHRLLAIAPVLLWLVAAVVLMIVRRRRFFGNMLWVICTAGGLAQVVVMIVCPFLRGAFAGNWLCCLGLASLCAEILAPRIPLMLRNIAGGLITVFLLCHYVFYALEARRQVAELDRVVAMIGESADRDSLTAGPVYVHMTPYTRNQWLNAGKNRFSIIYEASEQKYYGFDKDYLTEMTLLPDVFRDFDISGGVPVGGGWYDYEGFYVREHDTSLPEDRHIFAQAFICSSLIDVFQEITIEPFSAADGKTYDFAYIVGYPYTHGTFRDIRFAALWDSNGHYFFRDATICEPHHDVGENP